MPAAKKKTTTKKKTTSVATPAETPVVSSPKTSTELPIRKKYVSLGIGIVVLAALLYFLKGFLVAATVNGVPVTRLAVVKDAEKAAGKQALDNLITRELVSQEIRKQKVTVSDQELNDEIKRIDGLVKERGQNLEELLKARGETLNDFKQEVKFQLALQKIVKKGTIAISDQEITSWMEQNKDYLPQGKSEDELKTLAREQIEQQKIGQKTEELINELKKNAKVNYLVQY